MFYVLFIFLSENLVFFSYFNFIFLRVLRNDKNMASSTSWTRYSILNAVVKSQYSINLKQYPRVTALLKSYDTDIKKVMIFEKYCLWLSNNRFRLYVLVVDNICWMLKMISCHLTSRYIEIQSNVMLFKVNFLKSQ